MCRPGFSAVFRESAGDMGRAGIAGVAGEMGVGEEDTAVFELDEVALGVSGVGGAGFKRQDGFDAGKFSPGTPGGKKSKKEKEWNWRKSHVLC